MCSVCSSGWFGQDCDMKCIDNCDKCIKNNTCIQCNDGFYGAYCESRCPFGCESCSRDGEICNKCINATNDYGPLCSCRIDKCTKTNSQGNCIGCILSDWYPYEKGCCPCSDHCSYGNKKCNNITGACFNGCQTGYYGEKCIDKCSSYCAGNNTVCDSSTGECPNGCEKDWYLPTCKYGCSLLTPRCTKCEQSDNTAKCVECSDGFYKPDQELQCKRCEHCINDKCNGRTGICNHGCQQGWYKNSNGICSNTCPSNCKDGICSPEDGTCLNGCLVGFFTAKCERRCLTLNYNCLNNSCNQINSNCIACRPGYWDLLGCYRTCGNCKDEQMCESTNGICEGGCSHGYFGEQCRSICDNCLGKNCSQNGTCTDGCVSGKQGLKCSFPVYSEPEDKSLPSGAVVGIIFGIIAGLLITAFIVGCIIKSRRQQSINRYVDEQIQM